MRATEGKRKNNGEIVATSVAFRASGSLLPALPIFLGLVLTISCSFGCAPGPSGGSDGQSATASGELPEITDETIRERINWARVRDVPEENGSGEPIGWSFHESEPKEISVVDKQIEGDRATIILDVKTGTGPRSRNPRQLSGQIRTSWALRTGWVLRQWEIVKTENISMKYKNLPKPPPESNSNR